MTYAQRCTGTAGDAPSCRRGAPPERSSVVHGSGTVDQVGFSLISLGALLEGVVLVHLLAPMLLSIALIVAVARDTFSHQTV